MFGSTNPRSPEKPRATTTSEPILIDEATFEHINTSSTPPTVTNQEVFAQSNDMQLSLMVSTAESDVDNNKQIGHSSSGLCASELSNLDFEADGNSTNEHILSIPDASTSRSAADAILLESPSQPEHLSNSLIETDITATSHSVPLLRSDSASAETLKRHTEPLNNPRPLKRIRLSSDTAFRNAERHYLKEVAKISAEIEKFNFVAAKAVAANEVQELKNAAKRQKEKDIELKRLQLMQAKEEAKRIKEEEKRLKDEGKRMKKLQILQAKEALRIAKEEEKQRKLAEKEKLRAEREIQKQEATKAKDIDDNQSTLNRFLRPASSISPTSPTKGGGEELTFYLKVGNFHPELRPKDSILVQYRRVPIKDKESFETAIIQQTGSADLAQWRSLWKQHRFTSLKHLVQSKREQARRDSYDLMFGTPAMLDELPSTLLKLLLTMRNKLLDHYDDARPAYWGTFTRTSKLVNARCPFGRDTNINYDEDSADDWSEGDESDGEDLGEEEISEQDEYDLDDDLIDTELVDDSGSGKGMKSLQVQCSPLVWSLNDLRSQPQWISHFTKASIILLSAVSSSATDGLPWRPLKRKSSTSRIATGDPTVNELENVGNSNFSHEKHQTSSNRKSTFPQELVPALIKLAHGSRTSKSKLVQQFALEHINITKTSCEKEFSRLFEYGRLEGFGLRPVHYCKPETAAEYSVDLAPLTQLALEIASTTSPKSRLVQSPANLLVEGEPISPLKELESLKASGLPRNVADENNLSDSSKPVQLSIDSIFSSSSNVDSVKQLSSNDSNMRTPH